MMAVTDVTMQRYKSAIYLNNSAVTFMSHGEHVKAMETLSDALSLIKSVVQHQASVTAAQKIQDFARAKVELAQKRLASLPTASVTSRPIYFNVASYDGSLASSSLRQNNDDDWYTGVALTIDDVCHSSDMHQFGQETAPAIMLSNFALAHLYASRLADVTKTKDRMVDAALRMLDIALAVLGIKQRTMQMNEGNMFLALVLVNNLCCIHQQDKSCRFFDDLFTASQELDVLLALSRRMSRLTSAFTPVAGAA